LEGIRFADRLLEMLPCCRIVLVDFPADVEFLRSIRSDFSYLQTLFETQELLNLVADLKIQIDRAGQEVLEFFGDEWM